MHPRILLVEDEPILRLTLANDLAEEGYEVTCAAVPEPAWAPFEDRPEETVQLAEVVFTPGSSIGLPSPPGIYRTPLRAPGSWSSGGA